MARVSTGVLGLDEMLRGGFLRNRVILVRGGPGSGKTTFCLQFIIEGARKGQHGGSVPSARRPWSLPDSQ